MNYSDFDYATHEAARPPLSLAHPCGPNLSSLHSFEFALLQAAREFEIARGLIQ